MTKLAVLQLPTLSLSEARLDYYFKICAQNGVKIVLLGEYILNSFFKELEKMPLNMINQQTQEKKNSLQSLCQKYDLIAIAPLLQIKGGEIFKGFFKFTPTKSQFYPQQILISYPHWDEAKFFANPGDGELKFHTFSFEGLKFGVMFGFEAHFDACFLQLAKKNIDALLLPTACTFSSNKRWEELLKMRAFTNQIYILRANRTGSYNSKTDAQPWDFYGDSMLLSPDGEVAERLGSGEEMLVVTLDKKELNKSRNLWGFGKADALGRI